MKSTSIMRKLQLAGEYCDQATRTNVELDIRTHITTRGLRLQAWDCTTALCASRFVTWETLDRLPEHGLRSEFSILKSDALREINKFGAAA